MLFVFDVLQRFTNRGGPQHPSFSAAVLYFITYLAILTFLNAHFRFWLNKSCLTGKSVWWGMRELFLYLLRLAAAATNKRLMNPECQDLKYWAQFKLCKRGLGLTISLMINLHSIQCIPALFENSFCSIIVTFKLSF